MDEKFDRESSTSTSTFSDLDERRLVRKLDLRIVPSAMLIYLLCFLDRSNIGNAKLLNASTNNSLQQSTHTSNSQFTTALMIFLVAYILFETPSTYLLKRFRPSRWIALLMFGWGTMTICLGFVHNFSQLTAIRFLLGMFEAGLFPGLVYFLTFWYKPHERALRISLILACATLAGAFGGAIAYGIGKSMNGISGLEAWRWLFIIEGIPSCLSSILVFCFFPDYPESSRGQGWLTETERNLAITRLQGHSQSLGHAKISYRETLDTLLDWRLWIHYLAYITISVPFSSISLFSPTIVSGLGYTGLQAQLFTVPPYAIAFVVTVLVSWLSDRYNARSIGAGLSLFIAGVCFLLEGALPAHMAFKAKYAILCIGVSFSFASIPPLLSWLTANLGGSTSAATLAVPLNVSLGGVGQIIGVYIYKAEEAPAYRTGHYTNAGFALLGAVLVIWLRWVYKRRNRNRAGEGIEWKL
ncbi:hypothetical protein PQX77_009915 [Marasmius sp. AFHP31]|nr:hypothetical protein PQX77_009915 [Marasmius sp. AFHP31]